MRNKRFIKRLNRRLVKREIGKRMGEKSFTLIIDENGGHWIGDPPQLKKRSGEFLPHAKYIKLKVEITD